MPDLSSVLDDGVRYLRLGSLERAWSCFEAAAHATRDPAIRSEARRRQADVLRRRGQWDDALRLAGEAVQIARDHALREHEAAARNIEGSVHLQRGEFEHAVAIFGETLEIEPSAHQRGLICQNLGTAHAQQGLYDEAVEWYARSAAAFEEGGYTREQILVLNNQANVRIDQGELRAAEPLLRDALARTETLVGGDAELRALVELSLAEVLARRVEQMEEAYDLTLRAMGHFAASENRPLRVACHRVFALVTEAQGFHELAIGALERGLDLAREIQSAPEMAYFERELLRLRATDSPFTPA